MLFLLLSCGPKKLPGVSADDYFPLVEGARYHYVATFNGTPFEETRVTSRLELGDGSEAWAFLEEDQIGDPTASTFTGHFGLGLYRSTGGAVETIPAYWLSQAPELDAGSWQPMLDLPLQPGASITLETDSPDRAGAITVIGFETVSVPAGTWSG